MTKKAFDKWKQCAIKHFKSCEWTDDDLADLIESTTWEDLEVALFQLAHYVGERKGWGSEGIVGLHEDNIRDICKQSKIHFAHPDFDWLKEEKREA